MKDFYIGEEVNKSHFCSATSMFIEKDTRNDISENSEEYWVSKCIFDSSVRIRKSSRLGNDITNYILAKQEPKEIYKMVDKEILKNYIGIEDLYIAMKNERSKGFWEGERANQDKIKKALGII